MSLILDPRDEAAANGAPHESKKSQKRSDAASVSPSQAAPDGDAWTRRAPKRLRKGGLDPDAAWDAWWSKRQAPASVARLVHSAGSPLLWGWNAADLSEECRALVDLADDLDRGADASKYAKGKRLAALQDAVAAWVESARDGDTDVSFGLGCLAAAHVLNRLGAQLGPEHGWPLVDFLHAMAVDASAWNVDVASRGSAALAQQLVAGELPLALSHNFAELSPLATVGRAGRKQLTAGLAELAGGKGLVRAGHLGAFRGLLACWTRSRALGTHGENARWGRKMQDQFRAAVRQALRWTDAEGRALLADAHASRWTPDFLAAVLRASGDKSAAAAAYGLFEKRQLTSEVPPTKRKAPKPASLSERGSLALLRTSWSPRAATVAIDYSGIGMRLSISAQGRSLFEGVWTASSRIDGKLLKPAGPWEATCWFTDKDVDYLEFRLEFERGARLERQVLLARADEFLLLADHLQNDAPTPLEHSWQLPLGEGVAWRGEDDTRDAVLAAGDDVARVLPLALPEWRIDPRMGELTQAEGSLRLAQSAKSRALACPVFVDLKPGRVKKPCTWRQLTIAESLQIQPLDVAVGYRVQCGKKQWVIYRSQAPRGNRTLLGQNTSSEFLAARFLAPSGEIEELIQVEG